MEWALTGVQWLYLPILTILFTLLNWNILRTYWIRRQENKLAGPMNIPEEPIKITVMSRLSSDFVMMSPSLAKVQDGDSPRTDGSGTDVDGYSDKEDEELRYKQDGRLRY